MKDLVEYIVKQIVNNPEAVVVDESQGSETVNLKLTVDSSDMGVVIGKAGQTIKAIRKLLTTRAIADNVRVNLELVEPQPVGDQTQLDQSGTEQSDGENEVAVDDSAETTKK